MKFLQAALPRLLGLIKKAVHVTHAAGSESGIFVELALRNVPEQLSSGAGNVGGNYEFTLAILFL